MHRNAWKRTCAQQLIDKINMEPGEAAATAASLAELEEQVSGNDSNEWESPLLAADLHIAGMELNTESVYSAPQDPGAYHAAMSTRLQAARHPLNQISDDEE
jgi:hypothetical protein